MPNRSTEMNVLITGADGFIGKNLCVALADKSGINISTLGSKESAESFQERLSDTDLLVHLAGVSRPDDPQDFGRVNTDLVKAVCDYLARTGRDIPILFTSSTRAGNSSPYGQSKKAAEELLVDHSESTGSPVAIYRLPGVFGKWCKPNYNSVVATFCHNISHGLPIRVDDEETTLTLNYIDDVVEDMVACILGMKQRDTEIAFPVVEPLYQITLKTLVETLESFRDDRKTLRVDHVGTGLKRALYATYISYLDEEDFSYEIASHSDDRGRFVEFVKTQDSGQASYFTAGPGVSRGQHYHHTKTEKFLVVQGEACFRFRQLHTDRLYELAISSNDSRVVESIPGWAHDVTNIGESELIILVWASEVFDRDRPDTIPQEV